MKDQTRKNSIDINKRMESLELVVQTMDAGLWEWGADDARIQFDDRCSQMLEYSKEELDDLMQNWETLVHSDHLQEMKDTLEDYLSGKSSEFRLEYQCRKKTGEWLWVKTVGKTVEQDDLGRPLRTIGTQLDIQKRKTAELGLIDYQENLEKMILERTQKLEETQTELINKAIEAGRSQLSAMILHNIGNAITPVKVHVEEMLSDDVLKILDYLQKCFQDLDSQRENLTNYVNQNDRGKEVYSFMEELIESFAERRQKQLDKISTVNKAVSYISEILILQQAYSAKEFDAQQQVNLNILIEDALHMHYSALEKRNIFVQKELVAELIPLTINKSRLLQVIVNIIKNGYEAIDALNNPTKRILGIKTFVDKDWVGFEIADSGIGAEPNEIASLFEFGKSEKGSTGIGLYYCKAFVEREGGQLVFSSSGKGQGACVKALFPVGSR